jgi:hypothetical protein
MPSNNEAVLASRVDALVVETSSEVGALQSQLNALAAKMISLESRSAVLETQVRCLSEAAPRPQSQAA